MKTAPLRSWLIVLLLTLLICLAAGCGKQPPRAAAGPPITVTGNTAGKETITLFLNQLGVPTVIAGDQVYWLPSMKWTIGFLPELAAQQNERGVSYLSYEIPANNCNKFARFAHVEACTVWFHTKDRPKDTAIAFGEIWYQINKDTAHAINIVVCRADDGSLEAHFLEPQAVNKAEATVFLKLSQEQLNSAVVFF